MEKVSGYRLMEKEAQRLMNFYLVLVMVILHWLFQHENETWEIGLLGAMCILFCGAGYHKRRQQLAFRAKADDDEQHGR